MTAKSSFWLFFLLIFNINFVLAAQTKKSIPPKNPLVVHTNVEAQFKVKFGKIIAISQGSKTTCKEAHANVLNAFHSARVHADNLEYQVQVEKITTNIREKESANTLLMYRYKLVVKPTIQNTKFNHFLATLQTKQELATLLLYKQPVSCHYFWEHNQLIFLIYDGMLDWYEDFDHRVFFASLDLEPTIK